MFVYDRYLTSQNSAQVVGSSSTLMSCVSNGYVVCVSLLNEQQYVVANDLHENAGICKLMSPEETITDS